jgi:hypothetical protein
MFSTPSYQRNYLGRIAYNDKQFQSGLPLSQAQTLALLTLQNLLVNLYVTSLNIKNSSLCPHGAFRCCFTDVRKNSHRLPVQQSLAGF